MPLQVGTRRASSDAMVSVMMAQRAMRLKLGKEGTERLRRDREFSERRQVGDLEDMMLNTGHPTWYDDDDV